MDINAKCQNFLKKDLSDPKKGRFQDPEFKHSKYIVEIIPEIQNNKFEEKFHELEALEREVDDLVSEIINEKFAQFTQLIKIPSQYGEKYEQIRKIVNVSRKKIKRSKDLLTKKNTNLKQYYLNSIYNKEILNVLEKVEECNDMFIQIDSLLKNESFFEATLLIYTLRDKIKNFDPKLKDCVVLKHLYENEIHRTREVENLIKKYLKSYIFLVENEFTYKLISSSTSTLSSSSSGLPINAFSFDRVNNNIIEDINIKGKNPKKDYENLLMNANIKGNNGISNNEDTLDNVLYGKFGINLSQFKYFQQKLIQMKIIISSKPKNWIEEAPQQDQQHQPYDIMFANLIDPDAIDNASIIKFINFSFDIKQYKDYMSFLKREEIDSKQVLFTSGKNLDLINLYLSLKSACLLNRQLPILTDFFNNMDYNIRENFMMIAMWFLNDIWHIRAQQSSNSNQMNNMIMINEGNDNNNKDISSLDINDLKHAMKMMTSYNNSNNSIIQQYSSVLNINNAYELSIEILNGYIKNDLIYKFKYNKLAAKKIVDFFKLIIVFFTVSIKKNFLMQLILLYIKKETVQTSSFISIKEIWRSISYIIFKLIEYVCQMHMIDMAKYQNQNQNDNYVLLEKYSNESILLQQQQQQQPQLLSSSMISLGRTELANTLDDLSNNQLYNFINDQIISILKLNFFYSPFILNAIYKPLIITTHHILNLYENTPLKQFYDSIPSMAKIDSERPSIYNNIHQAMQDIYTKYTIMLKYEYIKLLHEILTMNDCINMNPEKNIIAIKEDNSQMIQLKKYKTKLVGNLQKQQFNLKEETKLKSPMLLEENLISKEDNKDGYSMNSPDGIDSSKKSESVLIEDVETEFRGDDPKEYLQVQFEKFRYYIPGIVTLTTNIDMLGNISKVLPLEKNCHILDLLVWSLQVGVQELQAKWKDAIRGTNIENYFKKPNDYQYLKLNPGFLTWKSEFLKLARINRFYPNEINQQNSLAATNANANASGGDGSSSNKGGKSNQEIGDEERKRYHKELKNKYKGYFNAENLIKDDKFIEKENKVILIGSIIENMQLFIRIAHENLIKILTNIPNENILNVTAEKINENKSSDIETQFRFKQDQAQNKEAKLKYLETLKSGGFLESVQNKYNTKGINQDSQNLYKILPENKIEWNLIKYWEAIKSLIDLIEKCAFTLKLQLHFRCFAHFIKIIKDPKISSENSLNEISAHDFTNFFRYSYLFYESSKLVLDPHTLNYILDDFHYLTCKTVKRNLLMFGKNHRPYIKTFLHNVITLENNMKKIQIKSDENNNNKEDVNFTKIKRFVNMFLLDDDQLILYIKQNSKKLKKKDIVSYLDLKMQEDKKGYTEEKYQALYSKLTAALTSK